MKIIDLTLSIENNMPTCGTNWHEKVLIEQMGFLNKVGRNTHRILLGSHSGTHMDAPYHFLESGRTIENTDLHIVCGDVTIINLQEFGTGDVVALEDIKSIPVTKRMLFSFGWFENWKTNQYYKKFPYFSSEAIEHLIKGGMKLMLMDTPSPDDGANILDLTDSPNHKELLKNDIVIVEYLTQTDQIDKNKKYQVMALPLKIKGSDGSPCRVILIERESE